jgi:hypothetical protein
MRSDGGPMRRAGDGKAMSRWDVRVSARWRIFGLAKPGEGLGAIRERPEIVDFRLDPSALGDEPILVGDADLKGSRHNDRGAKVDHPAPFEKAYEHVSQDLILLERDPFEFGIGKVHQHPAACEQLFVQAVAAGEFHYFGPRHDAVELGPVKTATAVDRQPVWHRRILSSNVNKHGESSAAKV